METLGLLFQGMLQVFQPINMLMVLFGGILGLIVGALPGLGSVAGCALLLPLTYKMNPTSAIIMLSALYYGNMFGGAISAILLNIPGDAPAVMTALDGYPMTQNGKAGNALFVAFFSSFIGGLIGAIIITCLGTTMARIGLAFGSPELAMLILLAMTSIGWMLGESPAKGMAVSGLGLLLATIGFDPINQGKARMCFGSTYLMGGIPFIPAIIGLFGFSQIIKTLSSGIDNDLNVDTPKLKLKDSIPSKSEMKSVLPTQLRSSFLGFFIGLLPGSGATTASFLTYVIEKRVNRRGDKMGTGIPDGVACSESANNAASIGAFVPLLSLGIPGSGTAAVLLGGLMMWGLQPGPLFMTNNPALCWSLIASMFIGDILIALICIFLIPVLSNILRVPNKILVPVVFCVCMLGAYCVNTNIKDLYTMVIAGCVGYIFIKNNLPLAPMVLAMVLGDTLEKSIRQGLLMGRGSATIFFTRPLSLGIFIVGVIFMFLPVIVNKISAKKKTQGES